MEKALAEAASALGSDSSGAPPSAEDEPGDASDSILVSDAEVGDSAGRPPSTVIGKPESGKGAGDSDLQLNIEGDASESLPLVRHAAR